MLIRFGGHRSEARRARAAIMRVLVCVAAALMLTLFPVLDDGWAAGPRDGIDAAAVSAAPAPKPYNWEKLTQEATALLSQYIRIDTSNPPGDELGAARMLRERFLADGIPATVWEPAPGRGVVAARLRGIGKHTKAIVLLSHMDVVPANPKQWQVPPFSGEVKDGDI